MNKHSQSFEAIMKTHVNGGCSLAEAFLRTFAPEDLQEQQVAMEKILGKLSIQGVSFENDYYFIDGSRLNLDLDTDSILATKPSAR
ncbi:hypothetical protein [uncultured Endozoicomonas sp.]|uniref:hypothetical protein n=1 Tax=uncultured Endozoicomonas sp. TaxID=432652 RepID=UPI002601D80A|nr:hypothetical protein [uncultured Endozoicomonas sp.]